MELSEKNENIPSDQVRKYKKSTDKYLYKIINTESLNPYEKNSRTHSKEQINQLIDSINEFGFTNPLLIDENHTIIAGHARLEAAKTIGLDDLPCIVIPGLTKGQRAQLVIADNKLALNAGWHTQHLLDELTFIKDEGLDQTLTGFTNLELEELFPPTVTAFEDEDEVPEIPDEPITKRGDVWLLGDHRLMCGDATMVDDIDKLMMGKKADMVFTDPPYNTGMTSESQKGSGGLWKGKGGSTRLSHMFNDSYTPEEWQIFLSQFMSSYWLIMKDDSVAYICLDWRRNHELIPHIEAVGLKRSNLIVWDKMVHGLGSDYKYTHEFINVCKKGNPKLNTHQGDKEYSDVWHIQRVMGKNDDHATAKPIELVERALKHASKRNDLVVDLFGGSGSTLIACEKHKRKCYMMELSEKYCDVIIKRWENATQKKAELES